MLSLQRLITVMSILCVLPVLASAEELATVESLIKRFDRDADQKLDRDELQRAFKSLATKTSKKSELGQLVSKLGEVAKTKADIKFLRVQRSERGKPVSMDTAITSYVSDDQRLQVDLVGAVHVGDKSYYRELNKAFRAYDVVLYELVAPEGTRVKKGRGRSRHPVGQLQQGMKSMLELAFQLEEVDYQRPNFVHADMSPEEFSKSMKDRGESWFQMFFRMMGQAMSQQSAGNTASDFDFIMAFMSKNRSLKLKQIMADQFENLEGQMKVLEGKDGSTIIGERNRKAFEVLEKQIKKGKKKIAVFYGAGHLPDMSERLQRDFGLKYKSEKWIVAWDMSK